MKKKTIVLFSFFCQITKIVNSLLFIEIINKLLNLIIIAITISYDIRIINNLELFRIIVSRKSYLHHFSQSIYP